MTSSAHSLTSAMFFASVLHAAASLVGLHNRVDKHYTPATKSAKPGGTAEQMCMFEDMGFRAENRRHNAEVIKHLFGRGTPDVPKLQRRGDIGGLVELLGYSGADWDFDNKVVQRDARDALVKIGEPAVPILAGVIDKAVAGERGPGVDDPAVSHSASALARMGPRGLSALVDALRRHGQAEMLAAWDPAEPPGHRIPSWAREAVDELEHSWNPGDRALLELITAMFGVSATRTYTTGDYTGDDAPFGMSASEAQSIRRWAQEVLGDDPGTVDALAELVAGLGDDRAAVRTYAAYALAGLGDERALEPLLRLAEDPAEQGPATRAAIDLVDPEVLIGAVRQRDAAVPLLGAILKWVRGGTTSSPSVSLHLPGDDMLARDADLAAELAKDEKAKQARCDTLGELAVRALLDLGGPGLMDGLVEALDPQFESPTVDLAVQALAELGDRRAVGPLGAYALRVHGHRPVGYVFRALRQLGGPEAASALSEWLTRGDPKEKQVALLALRAIADRDGVDCVVQSLPALLEVYGSEDTLLNTAFDALDWQKDMEREAEGEAFHALCELLVAIGEPAVSALVQIRDEHPTPYRREEAARLLDRIAEADQNRQA